MKLLDKPLPNFKEHLNSLNQKKDLSGRFCKRPFELLEIHKEYFAFPCCPSWLPVIVGNCDKSSIDEVWNNEKMQMIRQSIHDGSFKYCDHLECPEIQSDRLPFKSQLSDHWQKVAEQKTTMLHSPLRELALCYDVSCNLACPSCRTEKIQHASGEVYESHLKFTEKVLAFLDKYANDFEIVLRVTGSGDPIASPVFLKLLKSLDSARHSKLEICLQTNGVMLTEKIWNKLEKIHGIIKSISISIDAATESTYNVVRKFGNWGQLQKNLLFLAKIRKQNVINDLSLNFVVQQKNYKEMHLFVELAKTLGSVDRVFFSFVNDWDTWSKEEYEKQCIWKTNHPEFNEFLKVLKETNLGDPIVHLGILTDYRKLAVSDNKD